MEEPENALQVYNALNGTDYKNPAEVEMKRLDKGISLSMRNDAAFVIDFVLNLYEHQATHNPNIPIRELIYYVNTIEPEVKGLDLYSRRLIRIPLPHFVVFYNGVEKRPEVEDLYLSNSYIYETDEPELELKCTIYNINPGCNTELLERCSVLREYMIFVTKVRERVNLNKDGNLESILDEVIEECIGEHVLEDFLRRRKDEVMKMTTLDYTWERREELIRRDEREEGERIGRERGERIGLERGEQIGLAKGISQGLEALVYTLKDFLSTPEEIFAKVIENPNYSDVTFEQVKKLL
jgi:hypothetical protein